MATYNGTSDSGTFSGRNAADSISGFVGNNGLSGTAVAGSFVAAAIQEMADHSMSVAHLATNMSASTWGNAWHDGPAKSPFDQVVG
jgi:hypothetical protein